MSASTYSETHAETDKNRKSHKKYLILFIFIFILIIVSIINDMQRLDSNDIHWGMSLEEIKNKLGNDTVFFKADTESEMDAVITYFKNYEGNDKISANIMFSGKNNSLESVYISMYDNSFLGLNLFDEYAKKLRMQYGKAEDLSSDTGMKLLSWTTPTSEISLMSLDEESLTIEYRDITKPYISTGKEDDFKPREYTVKKGVNGTYTYSCNKICSENCSRACRICIMNGKSFHHPANCSFNYQAFENIGWIGCPDCGDLSHSSWYDWYEDAL